MGVRKAKRNTRVGRPGAPGSRARSAMVAAGAGHGTALSPSENATRQPRPGSFATSPTASHDAAASAVPPSGSIFGMRVLPGAALASVGAPSEHTTEQATPTVERSDGARVRAAVQGAWGRIRRVTGEHWLWFAVIALAIVLRFWGLGDKPLHHDESMHAFYSLLYARDPSSYIGEYQPILHGPFQFRAEGLMFKIILTLQSVFGVGGASGNPWINDATARIVPASFGVGIVALPYLLRRELGRSGAWLAALLLAVSPSFVYFSRFLREDIYFNFFLFAMVICAVRFCHSRSLRWLIGAVAATVLAYATFEGIFLTFVIFGAFLAVLVLWELGVSIARLLPAPLADGERLFFARAGLLVALGAVGSALGLVVLRTMSALNKYIVANPAKSQAQADQLENTTVALLIYAVVVIAVVVIAALLWQILGDDGSTYQTDIQTGMLDDDGRELAAEWVEEPRAPGLVGAASAFSRRVARLRGSLDEERQPLLRMLASVTWAEWFICFVVAFGLFSALYWVVPGASRSITIQGGFVLGVGRGIWQGLYYWLQQQQVARGAQPWYYYLMLIPLYEQLAVVFGLSGVVYACLRPTRFRLFLVWWFVASLAIYSWAGEKMPWLSIHILLPLMLLAALALNWMVGVCLTQLRAMRRDGVPGSLGGRLALPATRRARARVGGAAIGLLMAAVLLVPMVHSMWMLSRPDAAKGPLEMMVYVQTTNDVDRVMQKIDAADAALHGGQHQLRIVVGQGEEWPFYWYLRNYYLDPHPSEYAVFGYTPTEATPPADVLLLTPQDAATFKVQHPTGYSMKEYRLRAWFDESYKPAPCQATSAHPCSPSDGATGVGLGDFLSYGSTPPPHAQFNAGLAASRLWNWLWLRQPLGATNGSYDFVLVVRNGVPMQP